MKASEHPPSLVNGATLTIAPVQVPTPQPVAAIRAEWVRLPKPGSLCPWTGLSRSKLWEVLQTGKVRNLCLRKAGAVRGARLIHLASLLAYLDSLASESVPASESLNDDGDD